MDRSETLRNKIATFLECELDCNSGLLSVAETPQHLEPLIFQFLLLLIEQQGKVVSKEKVIGRLWGEKKASDEALRAMVKKTREALHDNARSPSYIKTIPTKGYLLIPPVELRSTVATSFVKKNRSKISAAILTLTILILVSVWWFSKVPEQESEIQNIVLTEQGLGKLQSKKVNTHYLNNDIYNISLLPIDERNMTSVVIENVSNNSRKEVVFSSRLGPKFTVSPLSTKLLVMRNNNEAVFSLNLLDDEKTTNLIEYQTPWLQSKSVLAANNTGRRLFTKGESNDSIALIEISSGDIVKSPAVDFINDYILNLYGAEQLNTSDISIWPSPKTDYFTVVFSKGQKSYLLVFSHIDSEEPLSILDLEKRFDSIVWNKEGDRFSFFSTVQDLMTFQVDALRLTSWNAGKTLSGKLVADCDGSCFVLANIEGKSKAYSLQNPFMSELREGDSPNIQAYTNLTSNELNDKVLLSSTHVYVVTQDGSSAKLFRQTSNMKEEALYTFTRGATVSSLSLSANDKYMLGLLDERPFLLNLQTGSMDYLQLGFPRVNRLRFVDDEKLRFYVPDQQSQSLGAVYEYTLKTKQATLAAEGAKQVVDTEINVTSDDGFPAKRKAKVIFTHNDEFKVMLNNAQESLILNNIALVCEDCWQVSDGYLYNLKNDSTKESPWILQRTNIQSGTSESRPMLINNLTGEFHLQKSSGQIVVMRRESADAVLVQVEGMQQVY